MDANEIIDRLGGPAMLARMLGFGEGSAHTTRVSQWRKRGIPLEHAAAVAKLLRCKPSEVRPDFDWGANEAH